MGSSEQFCLKWNDFHSSVCSSLAAIRLEDEFLDVTLVCGGELVRAHKLILSACSPLFRQMLKRNTHPNPMIYLRGIRHDDMLAILNFMYNGEVNVNQEDLQMFLAAADDLKIKGLSQDNSSGSSRSKGGREKRKDQHHLLQKLRKDDLSATPLHNGSEENKPSPSDKNKGHRRPSEEDPEEGNGSKKARTEASPGERSGSPDRSTDEPQPPHSPADSNAGAEEKSTSDEDEDGDSGNVRPAVRIKPELHHHGDDDGDQDDSDKITGHSSMDYQDDEDSISNQTNLLDSFVQNYAFQQQMEMNNLRLMRTKEQHHAEGGGGSGSRSQGSPKHKLSSPAGGMPYEMHRLGGRNEDGLAHVVVMKTIRGWHCPHCNYVSPTQKGNLKVHILNRHANPGESFACMFCGKHLSSRSSLQVHISQVHREQNKAKRMLEERMKINNLEERLKGEMASGIMGSGTAEALRQALQQEEKLKAEMVEMFRQQEEKMSLGEMSSGALTIQAIPNPSSSGSGGAGDDSPTILGPGGDDDFSSGGGGGGGGSSGAGVSGYPFHPSGSGGSGGSQQFHGYDTQLFKVYPDSMEGDSSRDNNG